jgi:hypothetical protein
MDGNTLSFLTLYKQCLSEKHAQPRLGEVAGWLARAAGELVCLYVAWALLHSKERQQGVGHHCSWHSLVYLKDVCRTSVRRK